MDLVKNDALAAFGDFDCGTKLMMLNTTFFPVTAFDGSWVGEGQCLGDMMDVFARKVDLFYNIGRISF